MCMCVQVNSCGVVSVSPDFNAREFPYRIETTSRGTYCTVGIHYYYIELHILYSEKCTIDYVLFYSYVLLSSTFFLCVQEI